MDSFKALLVDDEEDLVSTLVERLGYRGIEAEYALDGYSALAILQEKKFDVIVLDLKLPGMDGIEILEQIKQLDPHVPVLLITGHGSPVEENQEKPENAYDYLIKPINLETLIAKMREAVHSK